jgi:hypothetical protein
MFDDIVIGKGESGTTAFNMNLKGVKSNISQNSVSYWITHCLLDIEMKIFKDTKEGDKLTKLIKNKKFNKIDVFLDILVLKNLTPKRLKEYIIESNEIHFKNGKKQAQKEMRTALGILFPEY